MRIIAGEWRGRRLQAPAGAATRPTSDRARETLFSMLASRLGSFEGLRVVDLFAGTGALGLEALSRGAAYCTFVENDREAIAALHANIGALGAAGEVRAHSAIALPAASAPYDLVLLDPPYDAELVEKALASLLEGGWVGPATWLSVETGSDELGAPGYGVEKHRKIGKAHIHLLRTDER